MKPTLIFGTFFAKIFLKKEEKVYYLGYNFSNRNRLNSLGFKIIENKEIITQVAHELKYDFIDYISAIGKCQNDKVNWWASRIASKSNLQTDFFSIVCLLFTFKRITEENPNAKFVVDDMRLLLTILINTEINISFISKTFAILGLLSFVMLNIPKLIATRVFFIIRTILYNKKVNPYLTNSGKPTCYIYSWVEERSFDSKNIYNDPYFPNIDQYFTSESPTVFCSYYTKSGLIKRFDASRKLDGLSKYSSLWKILFSAVSFFIPTEIIPFKNNKLTFIWLYEILKENSGSFFISNIHDYYCWKGFFNTNKGKLIYPFENQPWEKLMIIANTNEDSKIEVIGCLHTTIHKLLLAFHTTDSEVAYLPLPKKLLVNSSRTKAIYDGYFKTTYIEVIDAGTLRFRTKSIHHKKRLKDTPVIGIMLSCIESQTLEQLYDLMVNSSSCKAKILVKPHPDLPVKQNRILRENVEFFYGDAKEFYEIIDILIYCSSTSGLEAHSYGIPAVRFSTQFLDLQTGEVEFDPNIIKSIVEINLNEINFHPQIDIFTQPDYDIWRNVCNVG